MSSQWTLDGVLEALDTGNVRTRNDALERLKGILRHARSTSGGNAFTDKACHDVYEKLFRISMSEKSTWLKSKTDTTRTAAESRLSAVANVLRMAVEVGFAQIKSKTLKALLDHLLSSLPLSSGHEFCAPLALDYAKSLRVLLSYHPHVEHLAHDDWNHAALLCANLIRTVRSDALGDAEPVSDADVPASSKSRQHLSHRTSHSFNVREVVGSQGERLLERQVTEELLGALSFLTAAPNAPLNTHHELLLGVLCEYLRLHPRPTASHQSAMAAVNNLLRWSRTESTTVIGEMVVPLIQAFKPLWQPKASALKDQILIALLYLRPCMSPSAENSARGNIHHDLRELFNVMFAEYEKRLEREQLQIESLELCISPGSTGQPAQVNTAIFRLRSSARAEHVWAVANLLGILCVANQDPFLDRGTEEPDAGRHDRPRKRLRSTPLWTELLSTIQTKNSVKTCSLQAVTFAAQHGSLSVKLMLQTIHALCSAAAEDNTGTVSWALLGLASCASQINATDAQLSNSWIQVWQLAQRSLSSASTCRSASHLLFLMMHLRLISTDMVSEMIRNLTVTMDLHGPSVLADSSTRLLTLALRMCQSNSPRSVSSLAESILTWLFRKFTPSKLADRSYVNLASFYRIHDVVGLIQLCLNHEGLNSTPFGLPTWQSVAQAWLRCEEQSDLIAYLLLLPERHGFLNKSLLDAASPLANNHVLRPRVSCEEACLNHFAGEMTRAKDTFNDITSEQQGRRLTCDMLLSAFSSCCVMAIVLHHDTFVDSRRQTSLQQDVNTLMRSILAFAASSQCEQPNTDAVLGLYAECCYANSGDHINSVSTMASTQTISSLVFQALQDRQMVSELGTQSNDADMDVDDDFQSQDSLKPSTETQVAEHKDDVAVAYSKTALRSSTLLYAAAISAIAQSDDYSSAGSVSTKIAGYILGMPPAAICASRGVLCLMPALGIMLSTLDAERLLKFCTKKLLGLYRYNRSEVSLGAVLDIMIWLIPAWTDRTSESLFEWGADIYHWITGTAASVLSPSTERQVAAMLLKLYHTDPDYGRDRDNAVQSARSSLFGLIGRPVVTLQFFLANNIESIFSKFVLQTHGRMFDDVQAHLPTRADWTEGMALRLLFLANLACSWRSLLRQCVYYIFETAGEITSTVPHAAFCISKVTVALKLPSAPRLFRLFAPQLFFTWLDRSTLDRLPYAAFQYSSLEELLRHNEVEISAQLLAQDDQENLTLMLTILQKAPEDLADAAFAKTLAYAISWDILSDPPNVGEAKLREATGSKGQFKQMTVDQFAAILGHFFLTVQQGDGEEGWLRKLPELSAAAAAYDEIKAFSSSTRPLPPDQQPSFAAWNLYDRIERLCRRTAHDPLRLWTTSSFALASRMLLDSIEVELGSLHTCLVLRRLRLLISMAGEVATSEFPLELLLHALRPLLADSECADDALGILQYLLHHGRAYMERNMAFTNGTILLTVLQMCDYSETQHNSTTQETQHVRTIEHMRAFHLWLVSYLKDMFARWKTTHRHSETFLDALGNLRLPGNARSGSAESKMILLLLDRRNTSPTFLLNRDCIEALSILSKNFEPPESSLQDCLEHDETACEYSDSLWTILSHSPWSPGFSLWAAGVIGRAFASTGIRPTPLGSVDSAQPYDKPSFKQGVLASQNQIATHLARMAVSRDLGAASLADYTLRRMVISFTSPDEATEFSQMLPEALTTAIWEGNLGYEPAIVSQAFGVAKSHRRLREALQADPSIEDSLWFCNLAITLCNHGSKMPILSALPALFENSHDRVQELLCPIIHILLEHDRNGKGTLKHELSASLSAHFEDSDSVLKSRKQFFLRLLLYLRGQSMPGEATIVDRLRWLNVDYCQAATIATECDMPCTALLFAESAGVPTSSNRRSSSRVSNSQTLPATAIPDQLLLDIFKQVDEPDSFYGVKQTASVASVLDRLDYEQDGLKSLMFRSAQMDSEMRIDHRPLPSDIHGTVRSLAMLNLHSLTYVLTSGDTGEATGLADDMLDAARKLQQWDMAAPEDIKDAPASCYSVFQQLSRASVAEQMRRRLQSVMIQHVQTSPPAAHAPSLNWCNTLATLAEVAEVLDVKGEEDLRHCWSKMTKRQAWTHIVPFRDCHTLVSNRQILFSTLAQNASLLQALHVSPRASRLLEAESLVEVARFSRKHSVLQEALSAAHYLGMLATQCNELGVNIDAVANLETASALWLSGEAAASVQLLRNTLESDGLESQSIAVGRSGLLAQLSHQLAEARLERPDEILNNYLTPAIQHLKGRTDIAEAGVVYHEFAAFCDQQLQNPGNIEDFNRISKLRQKKQEELAELEQLRAAKKAGQSRHDIDRLLRQTKTWISVDDAEYRRLKSNRDTFVQQSLQNYMLALEASDEHNISVLRFFALWLENAETPEAGDLVKRHLSRVPSWKFVLLLNQLMSRLEYEKSTFQNSLQSLAVRLCSEHPYHSLHHLYAFTRKTDKPGPALSRYQAATEIRQIMAKDAIKGELLGRFFKADNYYQALSVSEAPNRGKSSKLLIKDVPYAEKMARTVPELKLPPATIDLPLRPDGDYSQVPWVHKFSSTLSIMGGISAPKLLVATATDGKEYKQLFKSGNDDLRQDAIMEQVFEEVSKMLRNHKATRQRNLHVRTYKVIPLSATSGIIEFVANTIPLDEFLQPAHRRYHPQDMTSHEAREKIASVKEHSVDTRVKEFRKICDRVHPVLRYFFLEKFDDPDAWFEKRTAYTRTTAAMSMLGHVLGLGDRHCSNILLDERNGEAVHIDLGIAFEAGRVLPIPELVPFRLTRDVVDGMGVTKTEGVFRRCCEFTMDALREDKESIMTLLNVLRYDPLHSWTVSPLRAKRMQEAAGRSAEKAAAAAAGNGARGAANGEHMEASASRKKEQEAGEADRALSIVEKKLSKTLSTAATVNELIQQATDERNLGTLFQGWAAFF